MLKMKTNLLINKMGNENIRGGLLFLTALTLLALAIFANNVTAQAITLEIVTLNNTEFNTTTPSISLNITGNCSAYFVNVSFWNGTATDAIFNQLVVNDTTTTLAASALTAGQKYYLNFTYTNDTCVEENSTIDIYGIELNSQPVITAVDNDTSIVAKTHDRNWTVTFTDKNSTDSYDYVSLFVCKTDAWDGSCTGGSWCTNSSEDTGDGSIFCHYTVEGVAGQKSYYVFLADDNQWATSSISGTFIISTGWDDEDEEVIIAPKTVVPFKEKELIGLKAPYWILIAVIVIVAFIIGGLSRKR